MMAVANTTPKPMLAAIGPRNRACRLRSMMSGNILRNVVSEVRRMGRNWVLAADTMASAIGFHRPWDGERPLLQHHAHAGRGGNFVEGTEPPGGAAVGLSAYLAIRTRSQCRPRLR